MRTLRAITIATLFSASLAGASESPAADLSSLPASAQARISASVGEGSSQYHVRPIAGGFQAESAGLKSRFTSSGVQVSSGSARWGLSLRGYGYGNKLRGVAVIGPQAIRNRVEYRRGAVTEWYENGPMGLEQGFTISERPGKPHGQPLAIELEMSGTVAAQADGDTALKLNADMHEKLRYSGLTAYDADGKDLHARLELRQKRLLIEVNDESARYPVVVDPVVQLAKLTTSDGGALSRSVSISGDVCVSGTVGGAAYVFVKPPSGWKNMTQTAKLTPSVFNGNDLFGESVAISGNIIVVGAPGTNQNQGAAYVFVKPPSGWKNMTETARLVASDGTVGDYFGQVTVSGSTVVVGAPTATVNSNNSQGAAYVFTKSGAEATSSSPVFTEVAKLTASDGQPNSLFGSSASVSGDTVTIGAEQGDQDGIRSKGEAYVFVKPPTGWVSTTETAALKASDVGGELGQSVATNGSTVIAGAPAANFGGTVYIYVRPESGWADATESAQLRAKKLGWNFASSVAMDPTGHIIVAGAPQGNGHQNGAGDAFIFVEPPGGWQSTSDYTLRVFADDGKDNDGFGYSLGLSSSTLVVLGGGRGGAVYVFGKN